MSRAVLENFCAIQLIDLRFQLDHNNHKKIHLFEDYRGDPDDASLFFVLVRHYEYERISY